MERPKVQINGAELRWFVEYHNLTSEKKMQWETSSPLVWLDELIFNKKKCFEDYLSDMVPLIIANIFWDNVLGFFGCNNSIYNLDNPTIKS